MRQERVEEQILPHFANIAPRSQRIADILKEALKEAHADEIAYNNSARDELNRQYERVVQRLDRLYDDKVDGRISEEFYEQKFKKYSQEKEAVIASLKKHDTANTLHYALGANIMDLASRAREIYEKRTDDEKRDLLRLIFSNLATKQGNVRVSYAPAFQILAEWMPGANRILEPVKTLDTKEKRVPFGTLSPALRVRPDLNRQSPP